MAGGLVREDFVALGRLGLRVALAVVFLVVLAAAAGSALRIFRIFAGLD